MYTNAYPHGLGQVETTLPPGDVLRDMTQTELVQLIHQLAITEGLAKQRGDSIVATAAREARNAVNAYYLAYSDRDVGKLDRAIMTLDRVNQAVAASFRDLAAGVGRAVGETAGAAARGAFATLPFLLIGLAALFALGKSGGVRGVFGR